MEGVTTALTGFILLALAFPKIIQNKTQYYVAVVAVCLIILLSAVVQPDPKGISGPQQLGLFVIALLQLIALVCLVLSAGGLSVKELASDLSKSYEVIRRGEEEKEVIIPLPEHIAAKAAERGASVGRSEEPERQTYTITPPETEVDLRKPVEAPKPPAEGGATGKPPDTSIPLD